MTAATTALAVSSAAIFEAIGVIVLYNWAANSKGVVVVVRRERKREGEAIRKGCFCGYSIVWSRCGDLR
ncbi:hypothetical protein C5S29_09505 [ANME-1 cluster archaeon GoMg3.2]|nr:hypothetical protein [ANME-1 cluster archaeon GoMg3.2]